MGKELCVNGQDIEVEEDTTIAELKQMTGIPQEKPVTYDDGKDTYGLSDTDTVAGLEDEANVSSLPDDGILFG